ncbi:uncharacterized protein [Pleurodeles waltl]|uniref:uncharacterized protein n=1 Tax=Pleurodeles waltl TaxID=8319 RepID=UPI0037094D9D
MSHFMFELSVTSADAITKIALCLEVTYPSRVSALLPSHLLEWVESDNEKPSWDAHIPTERHMKYQEEEYDEDDKQQCCEAYYTPRWKDIMNTLRLGRMLYNFLSRWFRICRPCCKIIGVLLNLLKNNSQRNLRLFLLPMPRIIPPPAVPRFKPSSTIAAPPREDGTSTEDGSEILAGQMGRLPGPYSISSSHGLSLKDIAQSTGTSCSTFHLPTFVAQSDCFLYGCKEQARKSMRAIPHHRNEGLKIIKHPSVEPPDPSHLDKTYKAVVDSPACLIGHPKPDCPLTGSPKAFHQFFCYHLCTSR